ncbi:MAG: M1 family metallopeptidase [Microscillaceae bacterium]|nr:M1 family metallopeptidase [Microscillaceae bacterium]MDW8459661.1 M1 family metallopeptidase [Cytophagales bacterium]
MNIPTFRFIFLSLLIAFSLTTCKTSQKKDKANAEEFEKIIEEITKEDNIQNDTLPEFVVTPKEPSSKKFPYQPERTKKHDLLHTKLEVSFDWAKRYLYGTATLTLKPYFYPQNTLVLDAKGFDIHHVMMNKQNLSYQYDGKQITIDLGKTFTREQSFTIEIKYTAKPDELPKGGSAAITSDKGLYFINPDGKEPNKPTQIWTQGETEASSCWFPTIDSPNEKTTQEIYITVDKKYKTLSNGLLISSKENPDGTRTDYWKMDLPHAPYLFMMAIGNFAVVKDKWRNIELSYWVEPEYEPYAKKIFGNTPEMIEFFSQKLNYPYPWSKYAQVVVRDYVSGAMENTTASLFMEALQMEDKDLADNNWDFIIAHELFHQWFGDLTTCESWANLPLNEAFANYSEYLWAEYKYGKQEADYQHQKELDGYLQEAASKQEPLIRFHYKDREDTFDAHSYNKGGRVLNMLRRYVGDEAFWASLNLFLTRHKFQAVEAHQLRLCFEEITGEDLNWFFNQWFFSAGHPKLLVEHKYNNGKLTLNVVQTQDTLYTTVFKLPIQIAIWTNGKKQIYPITITKTKQTFEFAVEKQPDLVLFDEEQMLLAEVTHPKTPQEYEFQYYNYPDNYLARFEVFNKYLDKATANHEKILLDALSDSFWNIRLLALGKIADLALHQSNQAIKAKILQIAKNDTKTSVRAEAIKLLASDNPNQYLELLTEGLKANSNLVIGTSLGLYLNSNAPDIAQKVAMFEKSQSSAILTALAEYYVKQKDNTKYDWFVMRSKSASGMARFRLLQLFGQYLAESSAENQQKGVKFFENIGLSSNEPDWARFAAYQALGNLKHIPGAKEIRQKMKETEKDDNLKRLFILME